MRSCRESVVALLVRLDVKVGESFKFRIKDFQLLFQHPTKMFQLGYNMIILEEHYTLFFFRADAENTVTVEQLLEKEDNNVLRLSKKVAIIREGIGVQRDTGGTI